MTDLDSRLFMVMMGSFFILAGLMGSLGKWKRWYWSSRRMVYGYLPFGCLFFLAAAGQGNTDPILTWIFWGAEIAVLGVAFWWVIRPPQFIRPAWVKTIEARPLSTYTAMAAAVKNGLEWHARVSTPQELEKWIQATEKTLAQKKRR